jgi:predicted amidohydrolase YtcJ
MNPLKSALRHGVRFATHSDASVTRLDPLLSVWVAATRKTLSGKVLGPAERITVAEALRMVTIDAAYLMKQDDVKGTITQGKLADFVVLKDSPLDVPVDRVKDIGVVATVVGGKVFPVTYKKVR